MERYSKLLMGTGSGNQILNGTNTMSKIIDVFRKKWFAKVSEVGKIVQAISHANSIPTMKCNVQQFVLVLYMCCLLHMKLVY